jgi:AsmA protein
MPNPETTPAVSTRLWRRLSRLAVVCLLALAALVAGLPWMARQAIGPARLKALVEDALTDALGRKVNILGDVSIIVVPWLGLSIGPLAVADAPDFGPSPMLGAAHTEVTIRVLPLLARVVSPGAIRVRGLSLHLRRDASGRANWEDLTAPRDRTAQAPAGWQVAPSPGDIRIVDATLAYEDQATGRAWTVSDARLATGLGQPFNFSLSFKVNADGLGGAVECHAQGQAALDPETGRLAVGKARAAAGWVYPRPLVPGGATPLALSGQAALAYDPVTGTLGVTDLDARIPGARLTGTARLLDLAGQPRAEAALILTANPDGAWRDILGLIPGATSANLSASGESGNREDSRPDPAVVRNERLRAEAAPRDGQAVMTIVASADATNISLREARLNLPRGGTASARGTLVLGEAPRLDLSLAAEDVDFSSLPRPAGRTAWAWPAETLARLGLDARLELRRCQLAGMALTDFHATAQSRDGHARLYPVSAVLPSGLATLDAKFDTTRDGLSLDARAVIDPLPAEGATTPATTRLRLQGRLDSDGLKGSLALRSPDPAAAGRVLGLGGLPGAALECRGNLTVPGPASPDRRLELTDLEARLAGMVLRGQLAVNADAPTPLTFDLAADNLDADKLAALSTQSSGGDPIKAEGKLRVDRLALRGLDIQNLAAGLSLSGPRIEAAITGAELFGGRLTGKVDTEPSGRLTAALQLAGAEASRLPGGGSLSGQFSAKAGLETTPAKGARPRFAQATVDIEAGQLALGQGGDRLVLASPKAVLTVTGHEAQTGDDTPLDANLAVTCPGLASLRDLRLTAQGPLLLDKTGRLRESGPAKLEASALWPGALAGGRDLRLALAGPLTVDLAGGGFTAGDLRCDWGGLAATARIWRKAGEAAPTAFSLDTGQKSPRQVLAGWGVALPQGLASDRLTRGALSLSGTAGAGGLDIDRLALTLDESTLGGRISFPKYDVKRGKWDLALDRLDWDAYFPPGPPSTPAEREKPLDLRSLRDLSLDGRLSVGWLKKGNVTFDASTITGTARSGVFTFRQESPRFYGGRFFGEVRGDARDVVLKSSVELKLEGFECARFLRDWAEGDTLDSGGATFILAARTSGASEAQLRANLAGNARLQITRGELKVRDSGQSQAKPPSQDRIPFDVFSSSWVAREGVAHTDDFLIESPRMQVRGKGLVNLRDESIDLSVMANLADGGQAPATIVGPLDGPKLTIDRSKMFGDILYRVLQGIVSIPGKAVTHILQLR